MGLLTAINAVSEPAKNAFTIRRLHIRPLSETFELVDATDYKWPESPWTITKFAGNVGSRA